MLTCDSPADELIDALCEALKKQELLTLRMPGDKRPYNFPLPVKRNKPAVIGDDSIQQYPPFRVAEWLEWSRSKAGQAKIAAVEKMWAKTSKPGDPQVDEELETVSDDDELL